MDQYLNDVLEQNASPTQKPSAASKLLSAGLPATPGKTLFQGQLNKKKQRKIIRLEQWIEVHVINGKTVTTLYPSNEALIKKGQTMLPPPEYVYRRLCFLHGVPPEYHWTTDEESKRINGGLTMQRLTVDTWLSAIEDEKIDNPEGHLRPADIVPRPEETGGCDCEACTEAKTRIAAQQAMGD